MDMVIFEEDKNEIQLYYCENIKDLRKPSDPYIHPKNVKVEDLYYYDKFGNLNLDFYKIREIRRLNKIVKKKFSRKNNKKFCKYLNRLKGKRKYVFNIEPIKFFLDDDIKYYDNQYKIRKLLEWF